MPRKLQHRQATKYLMLASSPLVWFYPLEGGLFLLGQAMTMPNKMIYLNPDADIVNTRLGKVLGFHIYRALIRHRSGSRYKDWRKAGLSKIFLMSHAPFIPTLVRFCIVLFIPIIVALSFHFILPLSLLQLGYMVFFIFLGGISSDLLHIMMDIGDSHWKKSRKELMKKFYDC